MDNIRKQIFLAALLHDIGKFYQRTGLQDNFNAVFQLPDEIATNDSLYNLASNYHCPTTEHEALLFLADSWSTGSNDTEKDIDEYSNATARDNECDSNTPLYSIFNRINNGTYTNGFKLGVLSLGDHTCFPYEIGSEDEGNSTESYLEIWNKFCNEFKDLPKDSFLGFTESLLFLLKKYTWCMPYNSRYLRDVSLYDHLKTTAAIADCLYCYKQENSDAFLFDDTNKRLSVKNGEYPVLLVGGDVSGIQKFIYNIASRKAAVSLKGRSFYLQLLIDSIIQQIMSHPDIQCNMGHVVYSSGGKFYMLLPNTNKVKNVLSSLRLEFEKDIWSKHHGQLIFNLDYEPFAYSREKKKVCFNGKDNNSIGDLWKSLADKLTAHKNQKFKSILSDRYDDLFEPQKCTEKSRVCAVTGIESDKLVVLDKNTNEPTYVMESVKEQAELGNILKDADFILTYKHTEDSSYLKRCAKGSIKIVNTYNYLFDQQDLVLDEAEFRKIASADVCRVKRINDTNFLAVSSLKGKACSYGFQFYGGNKQAETNSQNKTFEQLTDKTYLGILRMDVDNLGAIFIKGLPDDEKSFSAYSTMSFMLDYFFSGHLNTIRDSNEFKDFVNILYSGGDDVFAIGRWDKLILFAETIRKEFQQFSGRSDISISGGITMVGEKYPISKAAELAGEAEDAAKKYKIGDKIKNALNLFGENVSWEEEFDKVKEWKDTFKKYCIQENMPRSILHRIMTLASVIRKNKDLREGENPDYSYIWHTTYFLTRFKERKSKSIENLCNELAKELLNERNYELIAIAARWAEVEMKEFNNN